MSYTRFQSISRLRGDSRHWCSPAALGISVAVSVLILTGCTHSDRHDETTPGLTTAPSNILWVVYQGISLPHASEGPRIVENGAATGFAHTPPGAGLAALIHTVRVSVAPDGQWSQVVAREVVAGVARDRWAVDRIRLSITGPAAPGSAPRLLGYRIVDYRPERAVVTIFTEYPDTSRAANTAVVVWAAGDWRLQLPDRVSMTPVVSVINELPSGTVMLAAPR